jgi:hypothetical protein
MGNGSQAYSVNLPVEGARTAPAFHAASSLFDRYNRPGLRLRECDPRDLAALHKNLVMSEQPLSREVAEAVAQKAASRPRELAATGEFTRGPPGPPSEQLFLRTAPLPTPPPSREFQHNELLFNYQGMADVKRGRKAEFLQEIEARIAEAEREIAGLEELQE